MLGPSLSLSLSHLPLAHASLTCTLYHRAQKTRVFFDRSTIPSFIWATNTDKPLPYLLGAELKTESKARVCLWEAPRLRGETDKETGEDKVSVTKTVMGQGRC